MVSGKLNHTRSFLLLTLCVMFLVNSCVDRENGTTLAKNIRVTVDAGNTRGNISKMLTGVNIVFSHDTDSLWADGRIAGYLKQVKAGVLRFPGGERVDYYHYFYPNDPNSLHADKDPWQTDPNAKDYSGTNKTNSKFMDVDEYLYWCRKIGAEPMLGINMESGLIFNRVDDSIKEAVDIVKYCNVTRDYNVKYWYLSNEPHFTDASHYHSWTLEKYAEHIMIFSQAMKAVDPNIKIIINWQSNLNEPGCWTDLKYLIEKSGAYFDYFDAHWYWAWGLATWDLWLKNSPMTLMAWCRDCPNKRYLGLSYAEEIQRFHKKVSDLGYDIKLVSLEWNIGPGKNFKFKPDFAKDKNPEFSRFQHALMHAEMLGQFIEGGLHMATMWPLTWSRGDIAGIFRAILDQKEHEPIPSFYVFKLYSNILGQKLVTSKASVSHIRPISALSQDDKTLWVYLLNKSGDEQTVNLDISEFVPSKGEAVAFTATDVSSEVSKLENIAVEITAKTGESKTELPPYSLTMLTLQK